MLCDKSLALPVKKQATATKLWIYLSYPPTKLGTLLSPLLWLTSHSKRFQNVRPTRFPRQQWPPYLTKNGDLSIVFSVQITGGSPTGPDPENRVGDQNIGSPGRPVYFVLQVSGEPGLLPCKNKTPLVNFPQRLSFEMSFNCSSRDE
jgi:hypothetical protein